MKNFKFLFAGLWLVVGLVLAMAGCGATGGSEAGNPSRSVAGLVASDSGSSALQTLVACPADTVVIRNAFSEERRVAIAQDCSFRLSLPAHNDAYTVSFLSGPSVVSSAIFQNSPDRFPQPVFVVSEAAAEMNLGSFVLNQSSITPENPPAAQNDWDHDGIVDYDDNDDDGDGVADKDERDCDLDGIIDDLDTDAASCAANIITALQTPLEVLPHAGAGLADDQKVVTTQAVRVRFSCPLDVDSLTSQSFVVTVPELQQYISCVPSSADLLAPAGGGSGFFNANSNILTCNYDGELKSDVVYTAILQGLSCEDGTPLPDFSWQWKTEASVP